MDTIRRILDFVNDRVDSDLIACIAKHSVQFGVTPRILCLTLLSWLRGRAARKRAIALPLKDYPWCHALKEAIEQCEPLSNLFQVNGDAVDFQSDIDSKTIAMIESEVATRYRPVLFAD